MKRGTNGQSTANRRGAACWLAMVGLIALCLAASPVMAQETDPDENPPPGGDVAVYYRLVLVSQPEDGGKILAFPSKPWYRPGEVVVLRAMPNLAEGYQFDHWTGATGGPVTRIVMDSSKRVVAHFVKREVTLLLDTRPWGLAEEAFRLFPEPIRILPTDDGRIHAVYKVGTFVTIFARNVDGHEFVRWSGDPPVDGPMIPEWVFMNPLPGYEMSRNKRLIAQYTRPLAVRAKVDYDWVYQNTNRVTRWRHQSVLKIDVANAVALTASAADLSALRVKVEAHPASEGAVRIVPTRNPLVWYIKGGLHDEQPVGNVILKITVARVEPAVNSTDDTETPQPIGSTLAVVKVRPLGDIDANGEVNVLDLELLKKRLSNEETPGFVDRHFDITGDGAVNRVDYYVLRRIVAGQPVP